jgi:hypothetical protein
LLYSFLQRELEWLRGPFKLLVSLLFLTLVSDICKYVFYHQQWPRAINNDGVQMAYRTTERNEQICAAFKANAEAECSGITAVGHYMSLFAMISAIFQFYWWFSILR